jgi:hypothetical protein
MYTYVCRVVILSDNYRLPRPVGLFITVMELAQPTANVHSGVEAGSDSKFQIQ